MAPHSWLWHYLWLAPHALQVLVIVFMVRRRLSRNFPMFLLYTAYQIVLNATLYTLDYLPAVSAEQYNFVQWIASLGSIALRFAIIHEIFSVVLTSYSAIRQFCLSVFRWSVVVLLLIAIVVALYGPSAAYAHRVIGAMILLDRAIAIVQCGLLFLLFLFSSYFGLSWRNYVFGIALGLALFSAVQLVASALQAQKMPSYLLDFVSMGTYHLCVLIWLAYLWAPEPIRVPIKQIPEHNLESWNYELERLLQR